MYQRYQPIFEFIKKTPEALNLVKEIASLNSSIDNGDLVQYVFCYEKQPGKPGAYIKAFLCRLLHPDSNEKPINVSRELMDQKVWFFCDAKLNFDAQASTLPEYREAFNVKTKDPICVYYNENAFVLDGFN